MSAGGKVNGVGDRGPAVTATGAAYGKFMRGGDSAKVNGVVNGLKKFQSSDRREVNGV